MEQRSAQEQAITLRLWDNTNNGELTSEDQLPIHCEPFDSRDL